MAKAIIWCRVSTDKQEFESQKSDLTDIATKEPYSFDKKDLIFIGKSGASAIKMNKLYQQEVDELIETIDKTPDLSTVFVWEVSRLARNKVAFQQMAQKLIESKIQLICMVPKLQLLDDNRELNNGSELTLDLLITLAKQEMEIKMKRFVRGKRKRASENRYTGGIIPFGYKANPNDDNKIVENTIEADIVRRIFNMYENGYSQQKIAIELKELGYTNPRYKKPTFIQLGLISHILKNMCYTGVPLEERTILVKDRDESGKKVESKRYARQYPQIISLEQFKKCRNIAEANRTVIGKGKNIYYATKLVKCTTCGCYWSASGSKVNYHCYNSVMQPKRWEIDGRKKEQCHNRTSMNINILDSVLWFFTIKEEAFFILMASEARKESFKKEIEGCERKLKSIPKQIEVINNIMDKLSIRNAEGKLSDEAYEKQITIKKEEKRQILNKELALKKTIENLKKTIDDVEIAMQKYGIKKKPNTILNALDGILDETKQYNQIYNSIRNITDDNERYETIHKIIERVIIANVKVKYKYNIGWRETKAKKIILITRDWSSEGGTLPKEYIIYYLPFNGKSNGLFLDTALSNPIDKYITDEEGNIVRENVPYEWEKYYTKIGEVQFENENEPHQVSIIDIEYLNRYTDGGKHKRREKEKEIAYSAVKGYFRIEDIMNKTGDKYSHIYGLIKRGRLKATILKHKCFIHPEDAENYINERNDKVQL